MSVATISLPLFSSDVGRAHRTRYYCLTTCLTTSRVQNPRPDHGCWLKWVLLVFSCPPSDNISSIFAASYVCYLCIFVSYIQAVKTDR